MAKGDDALAVLITMDATMKSIDATLKALLALSEKRTAGRQPVAATLGATNMAQGPAVAPASDLDSTYGDPEVKFNPRDWSGDSYKGMRFSQTSAPFLDQLAASFDYFAEKNEQSGAKTDKGQPKAPYDRKNAARARGWAARLRNSAKPIEAPIEEWGGSEGGKW